MKAKLVLLALAFTSLLNADFEYRVENSNFTISQGSINPESDKTYLYNYDRLRFRLAYTQDEFFVSIIADGVNYYGDSYVNSNDFEYVKLQKSDTPFNTQSDYNTYESGSVYAKLYRAYAGYEDDANRVLVGLQNISMGVGRIWNPTNLFNPRNVYALEPDEIFGVFGISYTRHIDDTSQVTVVVSQKADESLKYAVQYKAYLEIADFALDFISSNETTMLGYEIEGNLGETGVEVRSEGAYIKNKLQKNLISTQELEFFQGVIGTDYGFVNGITLVCEALYSSENFSYQKILLNYDSEILPNLVYSKLYTALSLSYSFNIYLDGSLTYIESFNDKNSRYVAPMLTYTLNDYNSLMLGAMIQNGEEGSEFEKFANAYYLKWFLSF
ncbi:MAG: hypothetical protein Q9M34_09535 [Sulfurimonas sp.]|nr:hypothetical protein [Sulfurimonas sp.]